MHATDTQSVRREHLGIVADDWHIDVAIIGAGPYGLSLATYLRAQGVEHRIFGSPMQAWVDMAPEMYLKSRGFATSIPVPQAGYELPSFCIQRGVESEEPIAMPDFIAYGLWVQQELVPYVEKVSVESLRRHHGGFEVTLSTGECVRARSVVNAIGLSNFERLPREVAGLPADLVSHTARCNDFLAFRGKRVVVLGAGQSALQTAVLLHEYGAEVELHVRDMGIVFGAESVGPRSITSHLRYPDSVLGIGLKNWALEKAPSLLHYVPEQTRVRFTRTHLGPAGAWWLRDRVIDKFPIHFRSELREALPLTSGVELRFMQSDGQEYVMRADHLVAGTGYDVDVDRVPYFDAVLASSVDRVVRAPRLSRHFETSVPGLYFVGPATALSFGPLCRFVAGAHFTSRVVSRHLHATANLRGQRAQAQL